METTYLKNIEYQYLGEKSNFFSVSSCGVQPKKSGLRPNHLGNVHLVLSDRKQTSTYDNTLAAYEYYPFGMAMQTYEVDAYRYGFQKQERDDELSGEGNSYNYNYRMHDVRLGRFLSIDPLLKKYPHNSTYAFSENSTIAFVELEGLEKYYAANGSFIGQYGNNTEVRVVYEENVAAAYLFLKIVEASKPIDPNNSEFDEETALALNLAGKAIAEAGNLMLMAGSHKPFENADEAAQDWGERYNRSSIEENVEKASTMYEIVIEGKTYINYNTPVTGNIDSSYPSSAPTGKKPVADIHSHGSYDVDYENNVFSLDDKEDNERTRLVGYVTTPNGSLKKYEPSKQHPRDKGKEISNTIPSDSNDPSRKNKID